MISYSPEFTELGPDALQACIDNGAAKVAKCISTESIRRLAALQKDFSKTKLTSAVPELSWVFDAVATPENLTKGMIIKCATTKVAPPKLGVGEYSHRDYDQPDGLSLLVPTIGERALFGADEREFIIPWLDDNVAPDFVCEYGTGDVLLLRQGIEKINEVRVELPAMFHCGVSATNRLLYTVDFLARRLSLPVQVSVPDPPAVRG